MRYNYITVEAQWVGSLGTGPTGSSLTPGFELLSAEAVTLSNRGGYYNSASVYLNLQQPKTSEGGVCLFMNTAKEEVVMVHN